MAELGKDIHVVSVPDSEPDYPVWPGYVSPWPTERLHDLVRATQLVFLDEQEVVDLMLKVRQEFDLALSKAQFEIWQLRGLLKSKPDLKKP